MFISTYFRKVLFKKEQGGSSSSFRHNTRSRFGLYCFLRRTSRFSTMQHFKVLLVLLFVAAVSISLTQTWTMNSKKVGKRKQILSCIQFTICLALSCQLLENCISHLTQNTTATATRDPREHHQNKKVLRRKNGGCARALSFFVHFFVILCKTTT